MPGSLKRHTPHLATTTSFPLLTPLWSFVQHKALEQS